MGAILAVISVGSAEITQNLDEALYGEGSRDCNGKKSKTVANSTIKGCKKISFAQVKLRPDKYPDGAGHYYKTLKLPNCSMPNSCRQDCSYFDRMWAGLKRNFTHIDKEGLIKRLVAEPCVWKSDGKSCEGIPCSVYKGVAKKQYQDFSDAEIARWAKILDKFSKSPLGKFLAFVPIVGSELEILFKDIKNERPSEADWVSFGADVVFSLVPGGAGVVQGYRAAKAVVGTIAKAGFKQAVKSGAKGAVRLTAKNMVKQMYRNPTITKYLRAAAVRSAQKHAIKGLARALSREEKKQIKKFVYDALDKRNEMMMQELLKQSNEIPEKYYYKKKQYEEDVESGKRKAIESDSDTRRKCLYVKGKKESGCWGKYIYRRKNKDGSYTKWGIKPTAEDMRGEAIKEERKVFGKKDAAALEKHRVKVRMERLKAIRELQQIQKQQDRERLQPEPNAREKVKKTVGKAIVSGIVKKVAKKISE